MRRIAALLTIGLLAACQLPAGLGGGKTAPPPAAGVTAAPGTIAGAPVTTTALPPAGAGAKPAEAAPAAGEKAETPAKPVTPEKPAAPAKPEPPPPAPEVKAEIKTAAQIACEKSGGAWSAFGLAQARTCVRNTRDGGRQCRREGDCEGVCLARSRTCAPVKPLFGCNAILQADGREVTLCLD